MEVVRYEARGGKHVITLNCDGDTWSVREYTRCLQVAASVNHSTREKAENTLTQWIQVYREDGISFTKR